MTLYWKDWDWNNILTNPNWANGIKLHKDGRVELPLKKPQNLYLIQTEAGKQQLLDKIKKASWVGFDAETNGLMIFNKEFKIAGLCFAFDQHSGYYIPFNHKSPDCKFADGLFKKVAKYPFNLFDQQEFAEDLKQIGFQDKPLIGHNIKFDLHVLRRMGLKQKGPIFDTLLLSQVEDSYRNNGLKDRIRDTFGYQPEEMDWGAIEDRFCGTDPRISYTYAAADPVNTVRLAYYMVNNQKDSSLKVAQAVEFPLTPKLVDIESFGIVINTELVEEYSNSLAPHMNELARLIRKYIKLDVNPASSEEKFNLIYKFIRTPYPAYKEPDRKGGTDDETLLNILENILEVQSELTKAQDEIKHGLSVDKVTRAQVDNARDWLVKSRVLTTSYDIYNRDGINNILNLIDEQLKELPIKYKILEMLISWGKMQKLKTAFVDKLPLVRSDIDLRLHTEFRQILNSGRQAGKNPNLMQLPRDSEYLVAYPDRDRPTIIADVRKALVPPPGYKFVCSDWDSMEMKMCAAISGCPALTEVVNGLDEDGKPYDIHLKTAIMMGLTNIKYEDAIRAYKDKARPKHGEISEVRQNAKPVGFGTIYGISKWGLAILLKCSIERAEELIRLYFEAMYGVKAWMDSGSELAKKQGYLETALGRRRYIPAEAFEDQNDLNYYIRALLNHEIQGGCADMAKLCEVQVMDACAGKDIHLCNFIHDELILAVKDDPGTLTYAGAILEACMQKKWRGIDFTAQAEVKENLSKSAPDLSGSIEGFGNKKTYELVLQSLDLTLDELQSLSW